MLAIHIRRIYMTKYDALLGDQLTFDEMTLLTCELGFLLMIFQKSSDPFEFKIWFQF